MLCLGQEKLYKCFYSYPEKHMLNGANTITFIKHKQRYVVLVRVQAWMAPTRLLYYNA